ncbi:hypothetical protein PCASD_07698 [Puccinia coronata f. sp. avenae]|uniref:Chromo domain-containing protein n=1 Tax=Puccinia coronata f. sp. avenae TaxID=200324 RepID=A0A2N5UP29_9BASI|nr:hypothetical protein PCASD_07698 [Puccinia coronata f. sp. avenae]
MANDPKVGSHHSMAESSSEETEYEAIEILKEKAGRYYIRWAGIDPETNEPWKNSWEPKEMANDLLVADWKEKKRKRKRISAQRNSYRDSSIISYHTSPAPNANRRRDSENRRSSRASVVIPPISPSSDDEQVPKRRKTMRHQPSKRSDTPATTPVSSKLCPTEQSSPPVEDTFDSFTSSQRLNRTIIPETQSSDHSDQPNQGLPQSKRPLQRKPRRSIQPGSSSEPNLDHSTHPDPESSSPPQERFGSRSHTNSRLQRENNSTPQKDPESQQSNDSASSDHGTPESLKLPPPLELLTDPVVPPDQFFQDLSSHHSPDVEDEYSNLGGMSQMNNHHSPLASLDDDPVIHRKYSNPPSCASRIHRLSSCDSSHLKKQPTAHLTKDVGMSDILTEEADAPSSSPSRPSPQTDQGGAAIILAPETPKRTNEHSTAQAAVILRADTDEIQSIPRTSPQQVYEPDAETAELIASLNDYDHPDHQSRILNYISGTFVAAVDQQYILKFIIDPLSYLADPTNEVDQLRKKHDLGDLVVFELERKETGSICLRFDLDDPAHPKYNFTWEDPVGRKKMSPRLLCYRNRRPDGPSQSQSENLRRSPAKSSSEVSDEEPFERPTEEICTTPKEDRVQSPDRHPSERPNDEPAESPIATPDKEPIDTLNEDPVEKQNEDVIEASKEDVVERPKEDLIENANENPIERPKEGPAERPNDPIQSVLSQLDTQMRPQSQSEDEIGSVMPLDDIITGVASNDPVQSIVSQLDTQMRPQSDSEVAMRSPVPLDDTITGTITGITSKGPIQPMLSQPDTQMHPKSQPEVEMGSPAPLDDTITGITSDVDSGFLAGPALSQPLPATLDGSPEVSADNLNSPASSQNQAQSSSSASNPSDPHSSSASESKKSSLSADTTSDDENPDVICTPNARLKIKELNMSNIALHKLLSGSLEVNLLQSGKQAELEESNKELYQKLEESKKEVENFEAKLRTENDKVAGLEARIRDQNIELNDQRVKIRNSQLAIDTLNAKTTSLETKLVEERAVLEQSNHDLRAELAKLKELNEELQGALEKSKEEQSETFEQLKNELIQNFEAELRKEKENAAGLESRIGDQEIELTGQRDKIVNSQLEIDTLNTKIASLGTKLAERAELEESHKEVCQKFEESKKKLENFEAKLKKESANATDLESRLLNQGIELTGQRVKIMNSEVEIDRLNKEIKLLESKLVEQKQPARQLYEQFSTRFKQELSQAKAESDLAKQMAKRVQKQKEIAEQKNDELLNSFSKQNQELRVQLQASAAKCNAQAVQIKHLELEVQDLSETDKLQKATIEELEACVGMVQSPSKKARIAAAPHLDANQSPKHGNDAPPEQVSQLERFSLGAQPHAFNQSLETISSDNEVSESQVIQSTSLQSSSGHSKAVSASHLEGVSQHSSSADSRRSCPPPNGQKTFKSIRSSLQYSSSPICPPRFGTSLTTPPSATTRTHVPFAIPSDSQKSGTQPSNH